MLALFNHSMQYSIFDGRGFAEYQSGRSWSVSENAHSFGTTYFTYTSCFIIVSTLVLQNGNEASRSISPASRGHLVKMLITLEPHGIF